MYSRRHVDTRPIPIPHNAIATITEEPGQLQYRRDVSLNAQPGLAHSHRQWPRRDPKFWIHESPSSSQDGSSNISSRSNSTKSEGAEERRFRTASPYGSFFVEDMEFDVPGESGLSCPGGSHERSAVSTDPDAAFRRRPIQCWESPRRLQSPMAQGPFVAGHLPYTRPPGARPTSGHEEATTTVAAETSLSPLSLAVNSRRSQPPVSWRQKYPISTNGPQNSRSDLPRVTMAVPPGSSISKSDNGQTRGMVQFTHGGGGEHRGR